MSITPDTSTEYVLWTLLWIFISSGGSSFSPSLHSIPPCRPAAQRRVPAGRAARLAPDVETPSPCVQMSSRTSETTGCSKPSARATLLRSNWHGTYWPAERWVYRRWTGREDVQQKLFMPALEVLPPSRVNTAVWEPEQNCDSAHRWRFKGLFHQIQSIFCQLLQPAKVFSHSRGL